MYEVPGCKGKANYFCIIFLYSSLIDNFRIVTECLRPIPTDHLPIFSNIQIVEAVLNKNNILIS